DKLLKAIELGLVTYMVKPINSQKLKSIVLDIVERLRGSKKRLYLSKEIYWDKINSNLYEKDKQIYLKEKELLLLQLLRRLKKRLLLSFILTKEILP
ncbi:MAG: hypothetical protein U9Q38_09065, partial [Thermodesulfobacteriota bacterium]|nr:hypothetical protein [Thermodesulfobacteriota bacterium]